MSKIEPNHIFLAIAAAASKNEMPSSDLAKQLYKLLKGEDKVDVTVKRCYDVYTNEYKRETLEAMLLVGATAEEVEEILRVPKKMTEIYCALFFDPSIFKDRLDMVDYAKRIPPDSFGGSLKQFAIDLGKECLKIKLSGGDYTIAPETVIQGVRATAYVLTQLARINKTDSSFSNAALRWAKIALNASPLTEDNEKSGAEELKIALQTQEEILSPNSSEIPKEEILH